MTSFGSSLPTNFILVNSTIGFNVGNIVYIEDVDQFDGKGNLIKTGIFAQIASTTQFGIFFTQPLNANQKEYSSFNDVNIASKNLKVVRVQGGSGLEGGGGVENLKIQISTSAVQSAVGRSNIHIGPFTSNVSIIGVDSRGTEGTHFNMNQCFGATISGCVALQTNSHSGGKGYGACCQQSASNCLVTNSIFSTLRHCMVVQFGANNNLFNANFGTNSTWGDNYAYPGDIQIHGNLANNNKFQDNYVTKIWMDRSKTDDHLRNGPDNVLANNRTHPYPLLSGLVASLNLSCFFLPNGVWNWDDEVCPTIESHVGIIESFSFSNSAKDRYDNGATTVNAPMENTSCNPPTLNVFVSSNGSFCQALIGVVGGNPPFQVYLDNSFQFESNSHTFTLLTSKDVLHYATVTDVNNFTMYYNFQCSGGELEEMKANNTNNGVLGNNIKKNSELDNDLTKDKTDDLNNSSKLKPNIRSNELVCYPNPTSNDLFVEFNVKEKSTIEISLYDAIGRLSTQIMPKMEVEVQKIQKTVNLSELQSGFYFVVLKDNEKTYVKRVIVNK